MYIGIDIGGSHISIGLLDENYNIICKTEEDTKKDIDIKETIIKHISPLLEKEKIDKIGISAPGIIANGIIVKAGNLGLNNFNIIKELQQHVENIPITLRNDGKSAAIAEKKSGALKEYADALFINVGTGIGGAAFLNNELLKPKVYPGFEWGHMIIQKNGNLCTCGKKGCWETYASIRVLKENIKQILNIQEKISGEELRKKMEKEREKIEPYIHEYVEYLAIGMTNLIDIFEPEAICIGGSFAHYSKILERLEKKINEQELRFNNKRETKIITAKFENDAGIIGAVI